MAQRQYSFFFTYLCQVTTCQVTEGQAVGAVSLPRTRVCASSPARHSWRQILWHEASATLARADRMANAIGTTQQPVYLAPDKPASVAKTQL